MEFSKIVNSDLDELRTRFRGDTYKTFEVINWDKFKDKHIYDFENHEEFSDLKAKQIRAEFKFDNEGQVEKFLREFVIIKNSSSRMWNLNNTLDLVLDENYSINNKVFQYLLLEIFDRNDDFHFLPRIFFNKRLKTLESANWIFKLINENNFHSKSEWLFNYFVFIDQTLIKESHLKGLLETIEKMSSHITIFIEHFSKYLLKYPNTYELILRRVYSRNSNSDSMLFFWSNIYSDHIEKLGNDFSIIKESYIQQCLNQDRFDIDGKGFLSILKRDKTFLFDYVNSYYRRYDKFSITENYHLRIIWEVDNIEFQLSKAISLISEMEFYFGILEHPAIVFFSNLNSEKIPRASKFIFDYCKKNFNDHIAMNMLVGVVRKTSLGIFKDLVLLYISLTQDVAMFSKIMWRGNGTMGSGNVILADIEAADWKEILDIVNESDIGAKLVPIKKYLVERIDYCILRGDQERQERFIRRSRHGIQ